MWEQENDLVKVEEIITSLKIEDFHNLMNFVLMRRLSNRWPYDTIKANFNTKDKFISYFLQHPYTFNVIYEQWKDYAERNTPNKTRLQKKNKGI